MHFSLRTRSFRGYFACAGVLGLLACASSASAQELRFSTTTAGSIATTGNALGLSKQKNANGPGVEDSIGTFTSLTNSVDDVPANPANPWPMGTTYDWTQNGSAATLTLPMDSVIQYAELIWGGSYNYVDDVSTHLDDSIKLAIGNASAAVAPDPATALTIAQTAMGGFAVNYYARSADVTPFVKAHGAGVYSVSAVPATQNEAINALNAAGWTLVVAYRDTSQPVRNLSVFVGGSFVDENSQQDYVVQGFCAPPSGPVGGKAAISALEGDANRTGDQLLIGASQAGPFVNLSGPNNPANNFFASQINDSNGNLDMTGTFGMANADPVMGVNVSGGRQGWDVTQIPVSSADGQLSAGQTSAVLRTITTGDSFVPTLAAFAIDVNAPNFTQGMSSLKTNASMVKLGDSITVTAKVDNQGQADATKVVFKMPVDAGLKLTSFTSDGKSGDVNGKQVAQAALASGVDEGGLASGQQRTVVMHFDVIGAPSKGSSFKLDASWGYEFVTCQGQPALAEAFDQYAQVDFEAPMTTSSSSSSGSGGAGGSGATSSSTSSASGGGMSVSSSSSGGHGASNMNGADSTTNGGCGCSLPDHDASSTWIGIGVGLAIAAATRRRRARRS